MGAEPLATRLQNVGRELDRPVSNTSFDASKVKQTSLQCMFFFL